MTTRETPIQILEALSPAAQQLAKRVLQLEKEYLHVKKPSLLTNRIVEAAKELTR
ncbi:hypothetical protein [Embleya sp. AB8]|uniref:hypothetical protein n=1 Tax=Embleya sp. AB8 TaxID=3156304 RepID=UPI003C7555F3